MSILTSSDGVNTPSEGSTPRFTIKGSVPEKVGSAEPEVHPFTNVICVETLHEALPILLECYEHASSLSLSCQVSSRSH